LEQIKKRWVIVQEPGCIPQIKSPMGNDYSDALTLIRELVECRPPGTILTLAQLTWNDELWVDSGNVESQIAEYLTANGP